MERTAEMRFESYDPEVLEINRLLDEACLDACAHAGTHDDWMMIYVIFGSGTRFGSHEPSSDTPGQCEESCRVCGILARQRRRVVEIVYDVTRPSGRPDSYVVVG